MSACRHSACVPLGCVVLASCIAFAYLSLQISGQVEGYLDSILLPWSLASLLGDTYHHAQATVQLARPRRFPGTAPEAHGRQRMTGAQPSMLDRRLPAAPRKPGL